METITLEQKQVQEAVLLKIPERTAVGTPSLDWTELVRALHDTDELTRLARGLAT